MQTMNITPWTIYIWQQADVIVDFCHVAAPVLACFSLLAWVGIFMLTDVLLDEYSKVITALRRLAVLFTIVLFVVSGVPLIIPRSNTIAMMYVLPEIANSRVVQKDLPEIYDAAIKALKQQLEE